LMRSMQYFAEHGVAEPEGGLSLAHPAPLGEAIRVDLPEAPTDLYLSWMSFLLNVDRRIRSSRSVLEQAFEHGFVDGTAPAMVRKLLVNPLVTSSAGALRAGRARMAPILVGSSRQMRVVADFIERWGIWLVEDGVLGKLGVRMPEPGIAALRRGVVRAIRRQAA